MSKYIVKGAKFNPLSYWANYKNPEGEDLYNRAVNHCIRFSGYLDMDFDTRMGHIRRLNDRDKTSVRLLISEMNYQRKVEYKQRVNNMIKELCDKLDVEYVEIR